MSGFAGKKAAAAASLKEACIVSADNSKAVAQAAGDRRVIGKGQKYGSAKEAREAKIEAAKAKRAAKEAAAKGK